jgi:hypothetical protein
MINEVELGVASKKQQLRRTTAWPTLLVPYQAPEDWQTSLTVLTKNLGRVPSGPKT